MPKVEKTVIIILGVLISVWTCLYMAGIILIDAGIHRAIFICVTLVIAFLMNPLNVKVVGKIIDYVLIVLTIMTFGYYIYYYNDLIMRAGLVLNQDIFFTILAIIIILEALRRAVSWVLSVLIIIVLFQALYGSHFSFMSTGADYSIERVSSVIFLGSSGIFGIPLDVAATFVFVFVLFGAFFSKSGVGQAFLDLAFGLFGGVRGGPAKVSIIGSGLMGSVSGSATANVVTTGVFTIPLMKKVGYTSRFAGAVEAVASTGGMIMPPIMAAVGFLIAQFLGIPYLEVMMMAIIPALFYYITLFIAIDAEAGRNKIKGIPKEQLPNVRQVLMKNWYLFLPLLLLVYLLVFKRWSPGLAGLISIVFIIVMSWIRKETRIGLRKMIESFTEAAKGIVTVAIACAGAGIIVGMFSLTGLGNKLSTILVDLAGQNLFLLLLFVAIIALILGMGLTATAVYLTLVVILAPAIQQFGLPLAVAHMFIFYYGILSNITPPVAIASFAAAGLTGDSPMKVAITSAKLAIPIYLIPFTFGFNPAFLLMGSWDTILIAIISGLLAVYAIATSVVGYALTNLGVLYRSIFFISGICLLLPELITDLIGVVLFIIVMTKQFLETKRHKLQFDLHKNHIS